MLRKPIEEVSPEVDPAIVKAINEVGDPWMMLIVWACGSGVTRFDGLQRELGVARNILSERLRRLVKLGVVEKTPIADGARRMEYRLTAKGRALQEPLETLADWARDWALEDEPASSPKIAERGDMRLRA